MKQILGAVVVILIVLALMGWVVGGSRSFQTCINSNQIQEANTYRHCLGGFAVTYNPAITALATVLLVFVTMGLVWTGYSQIMTTRAQLRAYCMVVKAEIMDVEVGKKPRAKITIRNTGQTPAKNFRHVSNMAYDTFPITRLVDPDFSQTKMVEQTLAPQSYFESFPTLSAPITDKAAIDNLRNGSAALYVIGEVHYLDAFGKKRFTKFKLFAGGPIGFSSSGMTSYEDGNDYT